MRRALCGILLVVVALSAVGFSDGPLRRLFQKRTTVVIPTKAATDGSVCVDGVCYSGSQAVSSPARIALQPTRPPAVVVGAPVPVAIEPETVAFRRVAEPVSMAFGDRPLTAAENSTGFRRALIKAAQKAARDGEIDRRDALRIRIACFSPAFVQAAEDLCVVQMAFSGDDAADGLPRNAGGEIDRTAIDWDGFASFLERILPVILQLIAAFGA